MEGESSRHFWQRAHTHEEHREAEASCEKIPALIAGYLSQGVLEATYYKQDVPYRATFGNQMQPLTAKASPNSGIELISIYKTISEANSFCARKNLAKIDEKFY